MSGFLVLLDRDGTVIKEKVYLADPDGVELVSGAIDGLKRLQEAGAVLVIISNQSGVGRGYFSEQDVEAVNGRMVEMLEKAGVRIHGVYYCPHAPEDGCDCRKPEIGLLKQAERDTGLPLSSAFMIGDKAVDVEAGQRAGCRTILVLTGYGKEMRDRCDPDFVAEDLRAAAEWIVAQRPLP
ncbi:MAG: HAD family hydrolase [candidate division KSB1 bacterium]|nr:HAD family hydrolase [candidate division KSB1 bacterium]